MLTGRNSLLLEVLYLKIFDLVRHLIHDMAGWSYDWLNIWVINRNNKKKKTKYGDTRFPPNSEDMLNICNNI